MSDIRAEFEAEFTRRSHAESWAEERLAEIEERRIEREAVEVGL